MVKTFLRTSILGFPIHTDYRVWVGLPKYAKIDSRIKRQKLLCRDVFLDEQPEDLTLSEAEILNFFTFPYSCVLKQQKEQETNARRLIDLEYDFDLIASAFYKDYGIDLWEKELHYHKFVPLFQNLNESNLLCKVMKYRGMDLSKIEDSQERLEVERLQDLYALPLTEEEQKEQDELQDIINQLR